MKTTAKQIKNFRYIFVLFLMLLCRIIVYSNDICPSGSVKLLLKLGNCAKAKEICNSALEDPKKNLTDFCKEELKILKQICDTCLQNNPFYYQAQYEAVGILKQQYEKQTKEQNVSLEFYLQKSQDDSTRAENAENAAKCARKKSCNDSIKAKNALEKAATDSTNAKRAIEEKDNALAQLKQIEKISNALYWYDDKIALVLNKDTSKKIVYCFIDKNGNEINELKSWDKAEPLGVSYIGYAKVMRGEKEYLIDTLGNTMIYGRAYQDGIIALDLSGNNFSCQVGGMNPSPHNCLENVFNDKTKSKIKENIKLLDLHNTKLSGFYPMESEFSSLEYLDLSNNSFNSSGALQSIENASALKYLILKNSKITSLPSSLKKMKNLIYLDVSGNNIKDLRKAVHDLIESGIKNLTLRVDEDQKKKLEPIMDKTKECGWKIII
jgi:hypothetical protein